VLNIQIYIFFMINYASEFFMSNQKNAN